MQIKEVISAFILTKNSEKTIERTLKSLIPLTSRIIILDTGSTDKTVQCCLQYGCTVWYDTWKDDFSYSRNLAKSYCTTPWLLMIDSDEELSKFDSDFFLEHIKNPLIGGFTVNIKNYLDNEETSFTNHSYTRVFRNDKHIQFEGKIHEQIYISIQNAGYTIVDSPFEISHFGYSENSPEKRQRNLKLLEEEYALSEDTYTAYQLILTYFADKKMDLVLSLGTKLLASEELTNKQKELIKIRMAQAFLDKSRFDDMQLLLKESFTDVDYEYFRKYLLLVCTIQLRKFSDAKQQLTQLLTNFQKGMVSLEELKKLETFLQLV